jgi:hypothetical protein
MASGLTPRANVPYPLNTDNAIVASDIQAVATFIDGKVPLFVKSTSAPASPIEGQIWWCPDTTSTNFGFNWYTNGSFFNVTSEIFTVNSSAPTTIFPGAIWYDTSTVNGELKYWNGAAWIDIIPKSTASNQTLLSSLSGLVWTSGTGTGIPVFANSPTISSPTISSATFTGTTTAPEFSASGLTGATSASRYVGATTSGAPTTGSFLVGDFVIDQTGKIWICTTAGSPGTWSFAGGGVNTFSGGATGLTPSTATSGAITLSGTLNVANGGTGTTTSTGSGSVVLSNTPTLTTPNIGAATGTSLAASGEVSGSDIKASGLTGAVAASRYVGATASGAPTTGSFLVGDFVIDQTGSIWVCTSLGSPGLWTQVGGTTGISTTDLETLTLMGALL